MSLSLIWCWVELGIEDRDEVEVGGGGGGGGGFAGGGGGGTETELERSVWLPVILVPDQSLCPVSDSVKICEDSNEEIKRLTKLKKRRI